jgi:hypothetical protein
MTLFSERNLPCRARSFSSRASWFIDEYTPDHAKDRSQRSRMIEYGLVDIEASTFSPNKLVYDVVFRSEVPTDCQRPY